MDVQTKTVTVAARGRQVVEVPLEATQRLTWEFSTESYDIQFSSGFKADGSEELVPDFASSRVDSHVVAVSSEGHVSGPTTYVLEWDNSFSMLRSKKVTYTLVITPALPAAVMTRLGTGVLQSVREEDDMATVQLAFGQLYCKLEEVEFPRLAEGVLLDAEEEKQALAELQELVITDALSEEARAWLDERCLRRYLIARQWKVPAAREMLEKSIDWRFNSYRPQDLRYADMEHYLQYFVCFVAGHDHDGRVVIVMRMDAPNNFTAEEKIRATVYVMERAIAMLDHEVHSHMVWVFDMAGFGYRHVNPRYGALFPTIFQAHYPERLGLGIIVNAPSLFQLLWKVVFPLLDEKTRSRIVWLPSGTADENAAALTKHMPDEVVRNVFADEVDFSFLLRDGEGGDDGAPPPPPPPRADGGDDVPPPPPPPKR